MQLASARVVVDTLLKCFAEEAAGTCRIHELEVTTKKVNQF